MNTLYVPLEDVKKILIDMIWLEEWVEIDAINSLPTIDLSVIDTMIDMHEKSYRNTSSYTEDGNWWVRGYKEALQELKSRLSPKN